jgi:hypothetical protein
MLEQLRHSDVSDADAPAQALLRYMPAGHVWLQGAHPVSVSMVQFADMYLCVPQDLMQDVHIANESAAQLLLMNVCPGVHWFGHGMQLIVSDMPFPRQSSPEATRLGGQSF